MIEDVITGPDGRKYNIKNSDFPRNDVEKQMIMAEIFKRGKSRATVQHGFLKYFVQPLFKSIEENIDGVNVTKLLQNIQSNMYHWEKLMENENV